MSKQELIQRLTTIATIGDYPETDHELADALLLDYINDVDVRQAFDKIHKWYA